MQYKAIFLDVDGVLVDSEKIFNLCWRKAAEQEGYLMSYEQALELRSLDSKLAEKLFVEWYGDQKAYSKIRATRKVIMSEVTKQEPILAKRGVLVFLSLVRNMPIKVIVVTSSPVNRITDYLTSVGIDVTLFDSIITTEQVERGKPFPDVYQLACNTIGYNPRECIAVEDSPNGLQSAHSAGCYTIMIPDLSPYSAKLEPYVDCVVESLDKITLFI